MGNAYYEKYVKNYEKTPKGRFNRQKANAKQRGVEWQLTFEEWWQIWQESGKWEERGTGEKNYCMSRKHDDGPYAVGNVRIITNKANSKFSYRHGLKIFKTDTM